MDFDDESVLSWRAVVLYGLNTATYKIALARCLEGFARAAVDRVPMPDLAAAFFDAYAARLAGGGMPQTTAFCSVRCPPQGVPTVTTPAPP